MKKGLVVLLTWLIALALLAAPAGAIGLGPLAISIDETKIEVPNFNFGLVFNDVFARANTGWNWTMGSGADVDTGKAKITAGVSNTLNSNKTGIILADYEIGPVAVNFGFSGLTSAGTEVNQIGPSCRFPMPCWLRMALGYWMFSGEPVAIAWDSTEIEVKNTNMGFVFNDLDLWANSGHNFTWGSKVKTGNAEITANVSNNLNSNTTNIAVLEGGVGPVAVNFDFGLRLGSQFFSFGPLAVAVESDEIEVENKNFGIVDNNVFARANTGWNWTIGSGADVDTGNASVGSTVSTTANSNSTTVVKSDLASGPIAANVDLDMGCNGGIGSGLGCLPVGGVGPVAVNIGEPGVAIAVETDEVEVTNSNVAIVTNNETLLANTGNNLTDGCAKDPCEPKPPCPTGCDANGAVAPATTVDTGDATVTTNITNTANSNETTVIITEGAGF